MKKLLLIAALIGLPAAAGLGLNACGDDSCPGAIITNCTQSCPISCGSGEVEACVGPDFGFDIGQNERCCFCQ